MWIFEVITWILFGLTIGGLAGWFMEKKRGHTIGYLAAGTGGAVLGGLLAELVGQLLPAAALDLDGFSLLSVLFSIGGAIGGVFIDRRTYRRGQPLVRDPRPHLP